MSEPVITELRGEQLREEMEERHGVQRLTLQERMAFYDAEELLMDEEALADAYLQLAVLIYDQERTLMGEQGDDYVLPAFVGLTNGATPIIAEVGKHLSDYGFDFDPFLIKTKTYGKSEHAKEPRVRQGLDEEDLVALNGRRIIIIDDMWDTGRTAEFVQQYLINKMGQGSVEVEDEDDPDVMKIVELDPISEDDVQFAFLLSKQPDITANHVPPTLWVHEVDESEWTTGAGGNSFKKFRNSEVVQSIGRFARIVTMRKRPEKTDSKAA